MPKSNPSASSGGCGRGRFDDLRLLMGRNITGQEPHLADLLPSHHGVELRVVFRLLGVGFTVPLRLGSAVASL